MELKKYLVKFYYSSLPIGRTVGQVGRKVYNFGGDVAKVFPNLMVGFVAGPCLKQPGLAMKLIVLMHGTAKKLIFR